MGAGAATGVIPRTAPSGADPPETVIEQLGGTGSKRPRVVDALQAAFDNPAGAGPAGAMGAPHARERKRYLNVSLLRGNCVFGVVIHHYLEIRDKGCIFYGISASQWILPWLMCLCGVLEALASSPLRSRLLWCGLILVVGLMCNFLATDNSAERWERNVDNIVYQMGFIIMVVFFSIAVHPVKILMQFDCRQAQQAQAQAQGSHLRAIKHTCCKLWLYLGCCILASTIFHSQVADMPRHAVFVACVVVLFGLFVSIGRRDARCAVALYAVAFFSWLHLALRFGWPFERASAWMPHWLQFASYKMFVVFLLGFSWGIMMKHHRGFVERFRRMFPVFIPLVLPFALYENELVGGDMSNMGRGGTSAAIARLDIESPGHSGSAYQWSYKKHPPWEHRFQIGNFSKYMNALERFPVPEGFVRPENKFTPYNIPGERNNGTHIFFSDPRYYKPHSPYGLDDASGWTKGVDPKDELETLRHIRFVVILRDLFLFLLFAYLVSSKQQDFNWSGGITRPLDRWSLLAYVSHNLWIRAFYQSDISGFEFGLIVLTTVIGTVGFHFIAKTLRRDIIMTRAQNKATHPTRKRNFLADLLRKTRDAKMEWLDVEEGSSRAHSSPNFAW